MYLRTIQRRNKDGSVVRYVQLAHNVRHPESGHAVAQVLHRFGREDQLDRDGLVAIPFSYAYAGVVWRYASCWVEEAGLGSSPVGPGVRGCPDAGLPA